MEMRNVADLAHLKELRRQADEKLAWAKRERLWDIADAALSEVDRLNLAIAEQQRLAPQEGEC